VAVVGFDALEDDAGRLVSSESDEFSCGFRDTRWLQAAAVAVRSKHDSRKVMSYSCGFSRYPMAAGGGGVLADVKTTGE
jgi:hypothetical protein